ncbi:armadillo/beta-catenin-like repeat-containing protein, putative [Eimeria praecox]|uniref:Armadillo/beta-catenin-like repeat-containing protein, putative n=1 Tax=Eimeria praecox TaxID=51316 RepID=U6H085_9EIME|nr:armadillo/beta-catenin-like repeat-containing protein, putative [Eimeria praecox]
MHDSDAALQQCKGPTPPPAASASLDELTTRLREQLSLSRPANAAADAAAAAAAAAARMAPMENTAAPPENPEIFREVMQLLQPLPELLHRALEQEQQQQEQQQQQQQQKQQQEEVVMLLLKGLEAAWCLTNLSSGSSMDAAAVVRSGTLGFIFCCIFSFSPSRLSLLCRSFVSSAAAAAAPPASSSSSSGGPSLESGGGPTEEEAFEQLLWALGNLTGDSAAYRDIVLSQELLQQHVLSLLTQPQQQQQQQQVLLLQQQQENTQQHLITPQLQQLLLRQLQRVAAAVAPPQQQQQQQPQQLLLPSLHQQLLLLLQHSRRPQTWRTAVWLISNLCRGTPRPDAALLCPLLPLLRHALQQASVQQVLEPQQQAELLLQQETLADACWAIDGLVSRPEGVSLLLQTPPLLQHVVHTLAHSSGCCCCAAECSSSNTNSGGVVGAADAAAAARAFELDVSTGLRNACCRVCNPQLQQLQQAWEQQQQQHMLLPLHPALRVVGQIAAGTARQTQQLLSCCCCMRCMRSASAAAGDTGTSSSSSRVLDKGFVYKDVSEPCCARGTPVVLRCLRSLLMRLSRPSLSREACWALSNLAVGSSHQLQQLLQCNVLRHALLLLEQQNLGEELRKEALWLVSNACTTAANLQQLLPLLQHGALQHLWTLLEVAAAAADGRAAEAALNALTNVIRLAEAAQQQHAGAVSCGCCSAEATAAQCSCFCHRPLLMLSSLMPGDEGLILLQQVHQQHLTAAADMKSDELACKLLRLRNSAASPYIPSSRSHSHLFVN